MAKKSTTVSTTASKKKVVFIIESEPGKTVSVAGTFNNWDPKKKILIDKNNEGIYQCIIMLERGTHEYKFFVEDTWCIDPKNPNFTPNDMGTLNSVLVVD